MKSIKRAAVALWFGAMTVSPLAAGADEAPSPGAMEAVGIGVSAINGVAHIMQDDLESTYNACFEADAQKNCTYKP